MIRMMRQLIRWILAVVTMVPRRPLIGIRPANKVIPIIVSTTSTCEAQLNALMRGLEIENPGLLSTKSPEMFEALGRLIARQAKNNKNYV